MSARAAAAVLSVLLISCVSACKSQPRALLNERFNLPYEQTATVTGTPLRITFAKLLEDSRCAGGMKCFWAGAAKIELTVTSGAESASLTLGTGEPRTASAFGYQLELEEVSSPPGDGTKNDRSQYVVTLKVTPLPGS